MSWIWLVLGALLIALVVSALVGFFYWRPRAQRRVTTATELLAAELHGRPPLLLAPAQCRQAELRDGAELTGLGVLALTEQAVLYSSGQRVVILARDGLQVQSTGTTMRLQSQTPPGHMVLRLPDPAPWRAALTP